MSGKIYITAPFTPYQFEEELSNDLEKDDTAILERRYGERKKGEEEKESNSSIITSKKSIKSQTQWTRALDVVQEHFSSHVILDRVSHRIPPQIYALKHAAKRDWILYKKRECERRKRIREKINREKQNERSGKPANVLLAMVDSCEACKRLYVTVNLFWGVTLCDPCYFNPDIINDLMKTRLEAANHSVKISSENIVEEVLRFRDFNQKTPSSLPPPNKKRKQVVIDCHALNPANCNNDYFNLVPFKPPSKEDAVVVYASTIPPPPPPPSSPGEPPGNELEKMEVAEGIMRCDDDPYFEDDIQTIGSLPSTPLPDTPQQYESSSSSSSPEEILLSTTEQQQPSFSHFKDIFHGTGENSSTILGSSPNAMYTPYSQSTIMLEKYDHDDDYRQYIFSQATSSQNPSSFTQWYNEMSCDFTSHTTNEESLSQ